METARTYNGKCKEMAELIHWKRAPAHAVAAEPLDTKRLFFLNMDNNLWQDVGLEDDTDRPAPTWLMDDFTQKGIRAILAADRGQEEHDRLKCECSNLQIWLREEWRKVKVAFEANEGITSHTDTDCTNIFINCV
jgi:hypothetical protein